jgi:hypothetical protein
MTHDLVLAGGRVLDPETGVDRVCDVGIDGGSITAVGDELDGTTTVDVSGRPPGLSSSRGGTAPAVLTSRPWRSARAQVIAGLGDRDLFGDVCTVPATARATERATPWRRRGCHLPPVQPHLAGVSNIVHQRASWRLGTTGWRTRLSR